jgi:hypothetical protein
MRKKKKVAEIHTIIMPAAQKFGFTLPEKKLFSNNIQLILFLLQVYPLNEFIMIINKCNTY